MTRIGLAGPLLLIFVSLKLTGVIGWSWFWVLSPAWIAAALVALWIVFLVFVAALTERR